MFLSTKMHRRSVCPGVRSRGGRPPTALVLCCRLTSDRSSRRPDILTASLVQLTTPVVGWVLGRWEQSLSRTVWRVYAAEWSRVQVIGWCTAQQLRSQKPFWTTRKGFSYAIGGCTGYCCSRYGRLPWGVRYPKAD
jgi:hypothetical protein